MNIKDKKYHDVWCIAITYTRTVFLFLGFSLFGSGHFFLATPLLHAAETVEDSGVTARRLQLEGASLQSQGKVVEALAKYKESLSRQPNQQLEALVGTLEKQIGTPRTMASHSEPAAKPANQESPANPQPEQAARITPGAAIAAAAAPVATIQNTDDSFGQHRLVERLSSLLQGSVLKGSETEVYLNFGQMHGASEGMFFEIIRPGAPIMAGGAVVAHEESKIAAVELTTVREKYSIGQVKEKSSVPQPGDIAYQQKKKIQRLVVGQFTSSQGLNQLTKALQEKLVTAFAAKGIQVVERDKLERVLQEQQLGYSGLINIDSAKKIGGLLGADSILLGTISDLGNEISLNGRLVDIGQGNTLSAGEVNLPKTPLISQLLEAKVEESGAIAPFNTQPVKQSLGKGQPTKTEWFVASIAQITGDDKKTYVTFTINNPAKEPLYIALQDFSSDPVLTDPATGFSMTMPTKNAQGISFNVLGSQDVKDEQKYSRISPEQSLNFAMVFGPLPKDFKEGPVNVTTNFLVLVKGEKVQRLSVSPTGIAVHR